MPALTLKTAASQFFCKKGFPKRITSGILPRINHTAQQSPYPMQPTRIDMSIFVHLLMGSLSIGLICWFSYSAMDGRSGMGRLAEKEAQITRLQDELALLEADISQLNNKTLRLSDHYLDLDLLDEQARRVLGMARPDELILR